jgi:hypothetical protein
MKFDRNGISLEGNRDLLYSTLKWLNFCGNLWEHLMWKQYNISILVLVRKYSIYVCVCVCVYIYRPI